MAGSVGTLREWLGEGPFCLALSSSWLGFFCHAGVVCALVESGFAPAKISGSSAGALVAIIWAATMDTDRLREIMQRAENRNPIMWASFFSRNLLPGVVNIHKSTRELLDRIMEGQRVPDLDDNPIPVHVSAFDVTRMKTRVFSRGNAADALAASMAVPLLFKPVWSNGRPLLDGAVGDVAGVAGFERSERILYHHATYLPLWLTQHLRSFTDLVAVKIDGLPYLNPWQLPGNGMDAFRLAKEATLRALDAPIVVKRGRLHGGGGGNDGRCGASSSDPARSISGAGDSVPGRGGTGLVRVRAQSSSSQATRGDAVEIRSRL